MLNNKGFQLCENLLEAHHLQQYLWDQLTTLNLYKVCHIHFILLYFGKSTLGRLGDKPNLYMTTTFIWLPITTKLVILLYHEIQRLTVLWSADLWFIRAICQLLLYGTKGTKATKAAWRPLLLLSVLGIERFSLTMITSGFLIYVHIPWRCEGETTDTSEDTNQIQSFWWALLY